MIAKVSGLAKVGLSVAAGLLGLTVLMTVLAAAGSEATREGESPGGYRELLGASSVATVTVIAYPTSIRVGGDDTSAITATLQDESGNVVTDEDGITVTFFTTLGVLGSDMVTKTTSTGVATAELTSEAQGGMATIWAFANSKSGWTQVAFWTPTTVTVVASPITIPIGGYTSTITATVVDQYENRVDPVTVVFTTSLGTISPLTGTTSNGEALTTLTSGSTLGTATVTATASSKVGNALVTFVTRIFLPLVMKSYTP